MCLGIPAQVVEVVDGERRLAKVDIGGVRRVVSVALLEGDAVPGDWVVVHVGFALDRIDEERARETLALIEEAYGRELDEVRQGTVT